MPSDNDIDGSDPDLTQLLVLEAGRILEDLSIELALRLPEDPDVRHEALDGASAMLAEAAKMLVTARQIAKRQCRDAHLFLQNREGDGS